MIGGTRIDAVGNGHTPESIAQAYIAIARSATGLDDWGLPTRKDNRFALMDWKDKDGMLRYERNVVSNIGPFSLGGLLGTDKYIDGFASGNLAGLRAAELSLKDNSLIFISTNVLGNQKFLEHTVTHEMIHAREGGSDHGVYEEMFTETMTRLFLDETRGFVSSISYDSYVDDLLGSAYARNWSRDALVAYLFQSMKSNPASLQSAYEAIAAKVDTPYLEIEKETSTGRSYSRVDLIKLLYLPGTYEWITEEYRKDLLEMIGR